MWMCNVAHRGFARFARVSTHGRKSSRQRTSPVIAITTSLSWPRQCAFPGFALSDPYPSQKTYSRPFSRLWFSSGPYQQSTRHPHWATGQGKIFHHASSRTRNDRLASCGTLGQSWMIQTSSTIVEAPVSIHKGSCSTGILGSPFPFRRILLVATFKFLLWDLNAERSSWHLIAPLWGPC